MRLNQGNLAIFVALVISGMDTARAQNTVDKLQPLVEASARRLALAEQVALAKWDSQAPVEDPSREVQVIKGAVKEGDSRGLDGKFVSTFFRAQIEGSKLVQYCLLADWYRAGRAPPHAPMNLVDTVRPELDRLQTALIVALADTASTRANTTCHANIARAVGQYLSAHKHEPRPLQAIALDRALATACPL
jgi:chorismate mutase